MLGSIALKMVATTYAITRPQRTTFVSLSVRVGVAWVNSILHPYSIPMVRDVGGRSTSVPTGPYRLGCPRVPPPRKAQFETPPLTEHITPTIPRAWPPA